MTNNLYIPLKNRSVIQISGAESQKFLQGLISNDINKVSEENAIYSLMLTPQGKFLYDFFICQREGLLLIDCNREKLPEIIKKLSMYKLRSDVKIEDMSQKYEVVSIIGDKIFEIISQNAGQAKQSGGGVLYIDPRSKKMCGRAIIEINNYSQFLEGLDFTQDSFSEYEVIRINACIPEGNVDLLPDKSFPHDFAMDSLNAIDYKKGCYVGQEVTARVHYKGTGRKKLFVVESASECSLPEFNSDITSGDEKIGVLLSSINNIGLATLIMESVEKNNFNCNVSDIKLKVRK
jgi:folate-binding protein YgfZ